MSDDLMLFTHRGAEVLKLPVDKVSHFINLDRNYVSAFHGEKEFLVKASISTLSKLLKDFVKVNRSSLVRKANIVGFRREKDKNYAITDCCGELIVHKERFPLIRRIALSNSQKARVSKVSKINERSLFTNDDIALALELNVSGIPWRYIEEGIGYGIHQAARDAKRYGMHSERMILT